MGLLEISVLNMVIACLRCGERYDVSLVSGKPKVSECKNCHLKHELQFVAEGLHERSSKAGWLNLKACTAFDYLPSIFIAHCFDCSEKNVMAGVTLDRAAERTCANCYHQMMIVVKKINFVKRKRPKPNGMTVEGKASKKKYAKIPGITLGQPLPDKGTCKHYRHSYRWLRFPCCGKAFPCDDCHNEASNHEAKWANRMICGYCALEQKFSNDDCVGCKKVVAGSGKKDKTKMSRKDPRKYAGLGKTKSRKSERVGPKKKD